MATEVKLPDLGEGIDDAIISRWLIQLGDTVQEGAPLVEIATDKVDTEMPSPASGVLLKIVHNEGELVPTGELIAVIGQAGEDVAESGGAENATQDAPVVESEARAEQSETVAATSSTNGDGAEGVKASPVAKRVAAEKGVLLSAVTGTGPGGRITKEDVLAADSGSGAVVSALPGELADRPTLTVRRLAALHNFSLDEVAQGRPLSSLSRYDVLSALENRATGKSVTVEPRFATPAGWSQATVAAPTPSAPVASARAPVKAATSISVGEGEELIKHTRMRQLIAKNMVDSAFTAPHVTTMWDVNMTAVLAHRKAHKAEYVDEGVNLTVTAYLAMATIGGLKAIPAANSYFTDEGILIRRTINLGMAVALPQDEHGLGGLIVPVIKGAGDLNLMGLARGINDIAVRARNNMLLPEDLQGSTFTLTNYGTSGSLFQTPIIAQGQAGILGVGAIEKRPVVVSQGHPLEANTGDYLTFAPMTTFGFSYDHRVLDGATADAFCKAVKEALEGWA